MQRATLTLPVQEEVEQPVVLSANALFVRINTKLKFRALWLRKTRWPNIPEMGRYYLVSRSRGVVIQKNVDLESYGRELGVLASYERLED